MCIHHKNKNLCRFCNVLLTCVHKREKYSCVLCKPYLLCSHNIRRCRCKECKIYYKRPKNKDNNIYKIKCNNRKAKIQNKT